MTAARRGWPFLLVWLLLVSACRPGGSPMEVTPSPGPTQAAATATPRPAPPTPPPTPTPEANIVMTAPQTGTAAGSPVRIAGRARVFEGALIAIVYDGQNRELAREPVQASSGAPEWGTFAKDVAFLTPERPGPGRIEVVSYSPRDGSVMDRASVAVTLLARPAGGAVPTARPSTPQR